MCCGYITVTVCADHIRRGVLVLVHHLKRGTGSFAAGTEKDEHDRQKSQRLWLQSGEGSVVGTVLRGVRHWALCERKECLSVW